MSLPALEIFEAGPGDRAAWSAYASPANAETGHLWEFHAVLEEQFRQRVFRLAARRGTAWVGVLPLVFQESFAGRFLTSVPYLNYAGIFGTDPEARGALAARAVEIANDLRADRLELRGRDGADVPIPTWEGKACYELALPATIDVLMASLGAKVRAQVKRPGKEGYTARVANGDGRAAFYPLFARRWHLLGSPALPAPFFHRLEKALGDDLSYVLVEKEGVGVAAGLLLRSADRVEISWAASSPEHDRFSVNMLLYARCFERAIEMGARWFDFGRSTPGSGTARFKLQWGATERPLLWNVHARAARGTAAERGDARREWIAATWRRLPRFVADRLGPTLARRIPY